MWVLEETALKDRLARRGVAVPRGGLASTPAAAAALASGLGYPVVVKAVVPVGGRGRRGLVVPAEDERAVVMAVERFLAAEVEAHVVGHVRVEEAARPGDEIYVGVTFDFPAGHAIVLWGAGGSDVEDGPPPRQLPVALDGEADLGAMPPLLRPTARAALEELRALGARLVELNPVRLSGSEVVVLDAKAVLDPSMPPPPDAVSAAPPAGDAARRLAAGLAALERPATVRFEELDGDVGIVMWGGGSTMLAFDALGRAGLAAANYSDMAGPDLPPAVEVLARTVLDSDPRAVLVGSTVSSALSVQDFVPGLCRAIGAAPCRNRTRPIAVRLAGAGEAGVSEALEQLPGVRHFGRDRTIEDAVRWLAGEVEGAHGDPAGR